METTSTTTVDLVIRLQVAGTSSEVATYLPALFELGEAMAIQAEYGLYALGTRDAFDIDAPQANVRLAEIEAMRVQAVLVEGQTPAGGHS